MNPCPKLAQKSGGAGFGWKTGGSGGARTRHKFNEIKGEAGLPSQIASQISGASADLQRVVDSWPALSAPLRAAILAIVDSALPRNGGGR